MEPAELAIVVPVFGHPALVVEALHTALSQSGDLALHVIAVVDGDEDAQLARTLAAFRETSDRFTPLKRRRGGLSAARNSGIDYALQNFPSLEAIFFLDADNRLGPDALRLAFGRIKGGNVDVLYPNLNNFGLRSAEDTAGPFSLAALLRGNYLEAGSLVSASVFRAGIRFHEGLRSGYEDWDFWLSVVTQGFKVHHDSTIGLRYRRRPESMLASTRRQSDQVRRTIEGYHQDLFSIQGRLRAETADEPRFAVIRLDEGVADFVTDPALSGERMNLAECERRLHLHLAAPTWTHFPPFIVFTRTPIIEALMSKRLATGMLWRLSRGACKFGFQALSVVPAEKGLLDLQTVGTNFRQELVVYSRPALARRLQAPGFEKMDRVESLRLSAVFEPHVVDNSYDLAEAVEHTVMSWSASPLVRAADVPWSWRGRPVVRLPQVPESIVQFPHASGERKNIGLVWPAGQRSNLDWVEMISRTFASSSWAVHGFIIGETAADHFPQIFETLTFLPDRCNDSSEHLDRRFYGTLLPGASVDEALLVGALGWLDALMCIDYPPLAPLFGSLRNAGPAIIWGMSARDGSSIGTGGDGVVLGAAYEHAVDIFVLGEPDLAPWLGALGVPHRKLLLAHFQAAATALVSSVDNAVASKVNPSPDAVAKNQN